MALVMNKTLYMDISSVVSAHAIGAGGLGFYCRNGPIGTVSPTACHRCDQWRSQGGQGQLPPSIRSLPLLLLPRKKLPYCFRNNTAITLFKPRSKVNIKPPRVG